MTDQFDESRRRGPVFWISVVTAAGVVALMAWVFAVRADPNSGYDPRQPRNNPTDGALVDMATELPYLDGSGMFSFSELEGKIVVVNFWASYCIPCRAEHAVLTSTFERYRDQNVQFLGIVYHDEPGPARAFLDEFGWGDGYIYVDDPDGRVTVEFGVYGVPETFFVNEDGVIVGKHFGEIRSDQLIPEIEAILAGDSTG